MPPITSTNGRTIRQRIIDKFEAALLAAEDGAPASSVFFTLYHGDPDELDNTTAPFCAIDEGIESTIEVYGGCTKKELPLFIHFRYIHEDGVDEIDVYKYYLGIVQMTLLPLHVNDDLITQVSEESNAHTILGTEDSFPGGILTLSVEYRHATHNPYKLPGEP